MEWAKEKLTAEEIKMFLLVTNRDDYIFGLQAAKYGRLVKLKKLLEWAKEKLKQRR